MPRVPDVEAEWSVLLTACSALSDGAKLLRLQTLLQSPIRWESLLAMAQRHGVQPLLYKALQSAGDAIPAESMHSLEQNYQTNLRKTLLLSRELIRVVYHLSAFDVHVMPYKGAALAESLYGDLALRQSGDIDLLVRRDEFPRVKAAMAKIGYVPQIHLSETEQEAYLKSGYECVFDGPAGRNILEIQWAVQPRFYAVDFNMGDVFERAVNVNVAGQPMKMPSTADLFLLLAAHAAKHVWARLIWISDLAQLMLMPSIDWDWIGSEATKLGIVRIVGVSMQLANRLLSAPTPANAQKWLPDRGVDATLTSQIQQSILSESGFGVESLSYFRLMISLRERTSDRLSFLTRLMFTPGPSEWSAVRLPASLFPLYRIVRLSRLGARMFGASD